MKSHLLTKCRVLFERLVLVAACSVPMLLLSGCGALLFSTVAGSAVYLIQERNAGSPLEDFALWAGIKNRLLQYGGSSFVDVNVDVVDNRVMLTGMVKNPKLRLIAAKIAWEQEGVKEVINEVQLYDTKDFSQVYASDLAISSQVRTKLLITKNIRSVNYSVETVSGIVYLLGTAHNRDELEAAADIASRVRGVRKVVAYVKLKKDAKNTISVTRAGTESLDGVEQIDLGDMGGLWD